MTDEDLHRRGIDTAVACWERFARSVRGAAVHRLRNVDVAVFPNGPERSIYNNAVLARSITAAECDVAVDVLEDRYAAAGVSGHAVWMHEDDDDGRDVLERRGYRIVTSTRSMGMQRTEFRDPRTAIERAPAGWLEHKRNIGVDAELLRHLAQSAFSLLVAVDGGTSVATGLSFDRGGDCGIYNVTTVERARRRGIGAALTAELLRAAWRRGCETATLQSTPIAEGVYSSIGFRDLGRIIEYSR